MRKLVEAEFKRGATVPVSFPAGGSDIPDSPRLTIAVVDPETEWSAGTIQEQIADWTKRRGKSDRLYPAALVWCVKKPGRDLREKVELWLAWKRVVREVADGTLGADYDKADRAEIAAKVVSAEEDAKDEVWASYRFVVIADSQADDRLQVIDLGAGHASSNETLCGRILTALKSQELLNESVGAGYLDRKWPKALKESGAWPLSGLRQSFLNGSFTRLLDPDATLKGKITEFVDKGDFGLGAGPKPDGTYERVWFEQLVSPDEIMFDGSVFLLTKSKAKQLKTGMVTTGAVPEPTVPPPTLGADRDEHEPPTGVSAKERIIRITGSVPPEVWNRVGTKLLPKLRAAKDFKVDVGFAATVDSATAPHLETELRQILQDLGLADKLTIESQPIG
jgi:hypothetical protein